MKSYRRMRKWTREMRCDYWTSLRDVCGFKVKSKGVVLFVFSCSHISRLTFEEFNCAIAYNCNGFIFHCCAVFYCVTMP